MKRLYWCLLPLLLIGCSSQPKQPDEPTLASLKPAVLPDKKKPLPQVGLPEVAQNYREVLRTSDDPELRVQVTQRLADLQMLSSEQQQMAGAQNTQYFTATIADYRALLAKYPDRADNDRLWYQLSKACDLDGRSDESLQALDQLVRHYPQSEFYVEAQFRRGELLFARSDYAGAEAAYGEVVRRGSDSSFYQNSLYMQGWSQFKRNSYERALRSFTETLDLLWAKDKTLDQLARADRELVGDTLRVMSLIFSYQDGARTITETYAKLGTRHYNAELYRQLGQLYLQQKRYRDAAETYRAYVDAYPLSAPAPDMYVALIAAYVEGNFPSEVLVEKGEYVKRYGIHSPYWAQAGEPARAQLRTHLKEYLDELARYHHAEAQRQKAEYAKSGAKNPAKADAALKAAALASYRRAGDYYREYIDTFPTDPQVGGMVFLLAEARFEAEDYAAAIEAYEQAAYQYKDKQRGAEAGYSAILTYDELIKRLPSAQQGNWQQLKIESELRFAQQYAADPRAVTVQTHAAGELFERKDYAQAVTAAGAVLQWQPAAAPALRRSAALVVGHGEFEQQHYAQAEQGYRLALGLIPRQDPEHAAIEDRLAAAVYKQGEQRLAAGDKLAAAQQFLRVAQVAPDSSIRVNAQYDAATQFMDAQQWGDAIKVLNDFRNRFPDNKLSSGVATKLAVAYQQSGQPGPAAAELTRVAGQDPDPATRREALFNAAELYRKAGDTGNAIARYGDYVKLYPQPFGEAMEARYQLTQLYARPQDSVLRRQWLQQIISADAGAGKARTDRSRFLAAQAQDELAEEEYRRFVSIHLTLPLKKSLKLKKAALEQALGAYQRCVDYGIEQFATKATFRIGAIYAQLSEDLLKSQRPPGLSDLEKEQYELLLEEQSDPFVDKAIAVHEGNAQRSWKGVYDEWVQKSFDALAKLLPARYGKPETRIGASDSIY